MGAPPRLIWTAYDVLGIAPTATDDEIAKRVRWLMVVTAPDQKTGDRVAFQMVNEAAAALADRAAYDAALRAYLMAAAAGSRASAPAPATAPAAASEAPAGAAAAAAAAQGGAPDWLRDVGVVLDGFRQTSDAIDRLFFRKPKGGAP